MSLPIVYHPDYVTPLPEGHRFPMPKFKTVYDILLADGVVDSSSVFQPEIAAMALLQSVHSPEYSNAFCNGQLDRSAQRRIGFPWSEGLVKRTRTAVGGTLLTARLALKYGIACNTAGGTHHAFPDFGSGFCIFNDLAVAARILVDEGIVGKILIVDLDVHQGDGSAYIFRDDERVFTFSMHCGENFPFKKQESDLDVALPSGMTDAEYLTSLEAHFPDLLSSVNPDLVLYDAGVDPHKDDQLGKLALSDEGLWQRDEIVLGRCIANGFPIATVIGGGYSKNIEELARRHTITHRVGAELYRRL